MGFIRFQGFRGFRVYWFIRLQGFRCLGFTCFIRF